MIRWWLGCLWSCCWLVQAQTLPLTPAQQQYLAQKQQLRYCVDPNWLPFESIDAKGNHSGMSADYQAFFQTLLPIPLTLVPTASWPESLLAAEQRRCDLLLLAMQTPARSRYLDFTTPYLRIPSVVVTLQNHPRVSDPAQLQGGHYGIRGGFGFAELYQQLQPVLQLEEVQSYEEGLLMVQSGQLRGMLGNMGSLSYLLQQYRMTNLKIAGRLPGDSEMSLASRNDEPELRQIADLLVAAIPPQLQQQVENKWLSVRMETAPDYQLLLLVVGVCSLVLALLIWAYLKVRRLNRQLLQANARLAHQSQHDGLTGLYNRLYFDEKLPVCLSLCQREQLMLTVAVLDLDHFKQINDQHGHLFGDQCLKQFAALLRQHFQRPVDLLARYGGEEFVLISIGVDAPVMARMLEQFLQAVAKQRIEMTGSNGHCTVSIGWVCQQAERGHNCEQWLAAADAALYQAKAQGRNCLVRGHFTES